MSAYLGDAVLLYLQELIDWESYFSWRKGDASDVEAERAALREVLETGRPDLRRDGARARAPAGTRARGSRTARSSTRRTSRRPSTSCGTRD